MTARPTKRKRASSRATATSTPPSVPPTTTTSGVLDARALAKDLYERIVVLRAEGAAAKSAADRRGAFKMEMQAVRLLSDLTGRVAQLTEAMILRAPACQRVHAAILDALKDFPDALVRVTEVLSELAAE